MRTAVIHYALDHVNEEDMERVYQLGSGSYFGESAYAMSGYQSRYWGQNYATLASLKASIDPYQRFGCHNCVWLLQPIFVFGENKFFVFIFMLNFIFMNKKSVMMLRSKEQIAFKNKT